MKKFKNWALFEWAIIRLEIDPESTDIVYKKCLKNNILLRLMDLSGVTVEDVQQGNYHKWAIDEMKKLKGKGS